MGTRVVVLGGGVGGLSVAQELAERGFQVEVYERRPVFGGKARSIQVPGSASQGRRPLPGEHGFRFFPSFYKHLPDTMKRIPFAAKSVFDNLVYATRVQIARVGKLAILEQTRFPQTLDDWLAVFKSLFSDLGIPERPGLLPEAELLDELFVPADVVPFDVLEKPLPLPDELHEPRAGSEILLVGRKVLDQQVDPLRYERDLDLGRARVRDMALVVLDNSRFVFLT